ncbi:MAG TPA: DMT family transporter [Macromonas sp.]|nr:DMT family transporter [Macromonas sp.]
MSHKSHTGIHIALFLTTVIWGLNVTVVKTLVQTIDVTLLATLRGLIGLVFLWLVMRLMRVRWPALTPKVLVLSVLGGFVFLYAQMMLNIAGLALTSGTNGALIVALAPFFSALLERAVFQRPLHQNQIWGIAVALGGVSLVILNRPHAQLTSATVGDLLVLGSMFASCVGGVLIQKLAPYGSPLAIAALMHITGSMMFVTHTAITLESPWSALQAMTAWSWLLVCYFAILSGGLASVVWGRGIATLGMGRTATYLSWVPVFGVGFSGLLLGETLTIWHGAGVLGVMVGSLLSNQASKTHAAA